MKKNILLLLICGFLTFGTISGVYAQETLNDKNSALYAQIKAITQMISNLTVQIEKLRQTRNPNNSNYTITTPIVIDNADQARASTVLGQVRKLKLELQAALMTSDSEENSRKGRSALDVAIKYLPSAERDYQAKRYISSYKMAMELRRSLEEALTNFKVACSLDANICSDGSVTYRSGPKCQFAACPTAEVEPAACSKEALICPDGSATYRSGPKCFFSACPTTEAILCTTDARQCPSGDWVSRSGPKCEFAACPEVLLCPQDTMMCTTGMVVGRTGPKCQFTCPPIRIDDY